MTELIYKVAGEDLSGSTQRYVSIGTDGMVYRSVVGDTRQVIGVLNNAPKKSDLAEITLSGVASVRVKSDVKAGDRIALGAVGSTSVYEGVTYDELPRLASTGNPGVGVALAAPLANGTTDVMVFIEKDVGGGVIPSQRRHVNKLGNDTTGDGSELKPFLTIEAAEASITDASTTKLYVIDIGPGTYALTVGFVKKLNIAWRGAGRRLTTVNVAALAAAGGLNCGTITAASSTLHFENFTLMGGATGMTLTQSPGTGGFQAHMFNCRVGNALAINGGGGTSGSSQNGQITLQSCEILGASTVKAGYLYAINSYFGGRITGDENTNVVDAAVTVQCNTTSGSSTLTFTSGQVGLIGGMRVSGTGIPDGTNISGAPPGQVSVLMTAAATATNTNVTMTFHTRRESLIQLYSCTIGGITLKKFSTGTVAGCHNQSTVVINDSGTSLAIDGGGLKFNSQLTADAGTTLTRLGGAAGIGYTPTTGTDWNSTAPVSVTEALDRLATVVKALNGGTGA